MPMDVPRLLIGRPPWSNRTFDDLTTNNAGGGERDVAETWLRTVGFAVWYVFLIICCIIPTVCAYRRRRAQRRQEQLDAETASINRMIALIEMEDRSIAIKQQQKRILAAVEETTMVVKESDFIKKAATAEHTQNDEQRAQQSPEDCGIDQECPTVSIHPTKVSSELTQNTATDNSEPDEDIDVENQISCSNQNCAPLDSDAVHCSFEDTDFADDCEHAFLKLREGVPHGNRYVSAGCAICLTPYDVGDSVTHSPNQHCIHAFHTDCLIQWLSKKAKPLCPCCRQTFCGTEELLPENMELQESNSNDRSTNQTAVDNRDDAQTNTNTNAAADTTRLG